jgi:lactate dehydrogenase-like 2-hydroxyacid dehydrogenase
VDRRRAVSVVSPDGGPAAEEENRVTAAQAVRQEKREMATVLITRRVPEAGPALLRAVPGLVLRQWDSDAVMPRARLLEEARGCDALLTLLTDRVDAELLDASGPGLMVVANMAVGTDNFDLAEMTRRGVLGTNTPEVLTETTADLAFALLLAAARMLPQAQRYVLDGKWTTWGPTLFLGQDVHHATLGVLGLGRIGAAVARRGLGFGMRVLYHDPVRQPELEARHGYLYRPTVEDVLREADFVSLHTPLTPATRHLLDAARLALMKPTAVLVNAARGPVVDPEALYRALRDGTIRAAGLDVTEPEPLPADHPLLGLENCLVLPHIGSASVATRDEMSRLAAENVARVLAGQPPLTPVNAEALGRRPAIPRP